MVHLIIVGSGIAGLFGAIRAAEKGLNVILVSKEDLLESNSAYAQGGIAAALGRHDSPELHFTDTMIAGDGLCYEPSVRILVEDGVLRVRELLDMGVKFDTYGEELALTQEGAHSQRRILHAGGDATGREIVETLTEIVQQHPSIIIRDKFFVNRLVIDDGWCTGVEGFDEEGRLEVLRGRYTMLATGGTGQIYRYTTNPPTATGDGMALAYLAGADMTDMEFVQFHPTALAMPGQNPNFLISEAVRGEGAVLRSPTGERFMQSYDPRGELAPRDVVSRSILAEMVKAEAGCVYLDFTSWSASRAQERFPTIWKTVARFGLDMSTDFIPVAPAAHYYMGGAKTDLWGRTTVPGLFAAGEVACTYCHGANRLGSNSLLEGLVFAHRTVDAILDGAEWSCNVSVPAYSVEMKIDLTQVDTTESVISRTISGEYVQAVEAMRHLMWDKVGILRDSSSLQSAAGELLAAVKSVLSGLCPVSRDMLELRNMLLVSLMAAVSAGTRLESRGGHYRVDHPVKSDEWLIHSCISGGSSPW